MKKVIFPLVAGLLVSTGAWAGDSGFYVLGGAGQTRLSYPKANTDAVVLRSTPAVTAGSFTSSAKDNPTAYKIQLGYQLDSRWAIEGGYNSLGQVSYSGAGTRGLPATAFTLNQTLKLKAWNVTAVGTFPINEAFSVLGKFGLTRMDSTNATTLPAANSVSAHTIKTGVAYGAGVKFDLNKDVMLRADFDNYDTGIATGRISAWTVGVGYRF